VTGVSFRKKWTESGIIDKLLAKLNDATEPNSEGGINFTTRDHTDLFFLLGDGVTHPETITRNDAFTISRQAFLDLRKSGRVSRKPLISEIAKRVVALEQTPQKKYTMWTKCRLRQMSFAKTARFDVEGVAIRTAPYLPKWLRLDEYFISGVGTINPNVLSFYGYLIFSTEARNENEASQKIFAAADLFFSVANTSTRSVDIWIQRVPSAILWLGPHQFFFENRKFIGTDQVWYNQNFDEKIWNRFPKDAEELNKRAPQIRRIVKALGDHPLRDPLRASLVRINEGMTSDDLAFRLMRFWSAAEALYAPGDERTPKDTLISRLTFASKSDAWLDRIKLEKCYDLRNMYVHRGSNDGDDTSLVQHLQELVLHQIYYYLFQGDDIESQQDLLMMLGLPNSERALEKWKQAVDRRINIARRDRHR
jgi:hypothetical protein